MLVARDTQCRRLMKTVEEEEVEEMIVMVIVESEENEVDTVIDI